mgnify:CR=1 FL=1
MLITIVRFQQISNFQTPKYLNKIILCSSQMPHNNVNATTRVLSELLSVATKHTTSCLSRRQHLVFKPATWCRHQLAPPSEQTTNLAVILPQLVASQAMTLKKLDWPAHGRYVEAEIVCLQSFLMGVQINLQTGEKESHMHVQYNPY